MVQQRALEYVEDGNLLSAMASLVSDMSKHEETREHPALELMVMLKMSGHLRTADEVRRFIEGFN